MASGATAARAAEGSCSGLARDLATFKLPRGAGEEGSTAGVPGAGVLDLGAADEALPDSLAECLFDLVARYGTGGDVKEGPQRSRDLESVMVLEVGVAEASPMKDAPLRAGLPETGRDRQVHPLGEYIAEVVDAKGGLVGNDFLR